MASPLKPYINARLLVPGLTAVTLVAGRYVSTPGDSYLVKCFMKRAQYGGVSSGSKNIPLESQLDGNMLPGAGADQYYYRGFAIEWVQVPSSWDLETSDESVLTFAEVTTQYPWMATGTECGFRLGTEQPMINAKIQRSNGVYGGAGIDEILYKEIGGVELQVTGAEIQN